MLEYSPNDTRREERYEKSAAVVSLGSKELLYFFECLLRKYAALCGDSEIGAEERLFVLESGGELPEGRFLRFVPLKRKLLGVLKLAAPGEEFALVDSWQTPNELSGVCNGHVDMA
jgi:hypothetical protein